MTIQFEFEYLIVVLGFLKLRNLRKISNLPHPVITIFNGLSSHKLQPLNWEWEWRCIIWTSGNYLPIWYLDATLTFLYLAKVRILIPLPDYTNTHLMQGCIQNPVGHLRWSLLDMFIKKGKLCDISKFAKNLSL